jgi:hypothetical protein
VDLKNLYIITVMKNIILWFILPLIAIQFIDLDVAQNIPIDKKLQLKASKEVMDILNRSCVDCHSNRVKYPWYDYIAPIKWYAQIHVKNGRRAFNYDIWNSYNRDKKIKILEKIPDVLKIRMPLPSYLWLHKEAKLSKDDKKILKKWAEGLQKEL